MIGQFEVSKTSNDKFMFNLKASDGAIVLTSQPYEAKAGAMQGIESVRVNATLGERFERLNSTHDWPCFRLKAANGQVIGRSQMYASLAALEVGIASVARNAPFAPTFDLTA